MLEIVTIETPELGDRSYLLHDGAAAAAIDPQRDIDRILEAAARAGVTIACVAETHIHNDYVSGGLELARTTGADYLVAASDEVAYARRPVAAGDSVAVGSFALGVRATPGHTPNHLAYVVEQDGAPRAVLTGGSLLFGTVGRTDLIGPERTDELTRAQYRGVRALAGALGDEVAVLPTHGFGSFCSSAPPAEGARASIGEERARNLVFTVEDEDAFVAALRAGLGAYPGYYAAMGPTNRAGPDPFPAGPPRPVEAGELARRLESGEWVVDLRERRAFAASHLAGAVGFEHTQPFTTYLGWVVPRDARITLLGETAAQVAGAARDLARIGLDHPEGAYASVAELAERHALDLASHPVTDFAGLAAALARGEELVVLDVRRADEWSEGHVASAVNVFVAELARRLGAIPPGRVWVHCAAGYRAAIAASLLARAGRSVVLVDDDWANAACAGLPIERGAPQRGA